MPLSPAPSLPAEDRGSSHEQIGFEIRHPAGQRHQGTSHTRIQQAALEDTSHLLRAERYARSVELQYPYNTDQQVRCREDEETLSYESSIGLCGLLWCIRDIVLRCIVRRPQFVSVRSLYLTEWWLDSTVIITERADQDHHGGERMIRVGGGLRLAAEWRPLSSRSDWLGGHSSVAVSSSQQLV